MTHLHTGMEIDFDAVSEAYFRPMTLPTWPDIERHLELRITSSLVTDILEFQMSADVDPSRQCHIVLMLWLKVSRYDFGMVSNSV